MRRALVPTISTLATGATLAACGGQAARPVEAASAIYVRSDSDATTVVSPRLRVAGAVSDDATVEAAYAVDAWTGASIDVVTAATGTIREQRNEATVGGGYAFGALKLATSYRYSTENDYWSHGGVLGATLDLAQQNTTLALYALGSGDTVGRAGDPGFAQRLWTAGLRGSVTQVIDPQTIAELTWETTRLAGFQASPYRWVAIGGMGVCGGDAPYCVPEHVPEVRYRHAPSLRARRALGEHLTVGLEYRFYLDSWGVRAHTAQPQLAWRVADADAVVVRYRYYTQGEADFYRPRYFDAATTDGLVTRDRKLSAFYSHEVGVEYLRELRFDDSDVVIALGVRSSLSRLAYLAFVGLDRVYALELTTLISLERE